MIPETVLPSLTFSFEEPDILVTRVTTHELIDVESVLGVTRIGPQVFNQRDDIYWLNYLGNVKGLVPESKPLLKHIPVLRPYAWVGVSDSLVTRTWLQIVLRGLWLIGRLSGKIVFVKSESEARDWIQEDRDRERRARRESGGQTGAG